MISSKVRRALSYFLNRGHGTGVTSQASYTDNILFKVYIHVDTEKCKEIPIIMRDSVANLCDTSGKEHVECCWPMNYGKVCTKSGFASAFTEFANSTGAKVIIKEETYYAGKGFILNKDMKPLVLVTRYSEVPHNIYSDGKTIIRVSPKVLTSKGIMEKSIVKYLIPYIEESGLLHQYAIVIEEFNDFFFKYPKAPTDIEEANTIVKENKELIHNLFLYK